MKIKSEELKNIKGKNIFNYFFIINKFLIEKLEVNL
jgi:hypothetical protein